MEFAPITPSSRPTKTLSTNLSNTRGATLAHWDIMHEIIAWHRLRGRDLFSPCPGLHRPPINSYIIMDFIKEFESHLPKMLRRKLNKLDKPFTVQQYLDSLTYRGEERDRSPLNVMLDGQGHCLDGGFLAALCLWRIGFKPLLIDIVPDPGVDDDHVLALYQIEGRWGALAKSNYINLGFREPVYKNLRELVMSYFEHYVSIHQQKCLTGYTRVFDASRYRRYNWAWDEAGANKVYHRYFYGRKAIPLISKSMAGRLSPVTDRAYASETMFTDLSESFGNRSY